MIKGLIRLCYRKIVDASSASAWDRHVFDDTHREFYMQAQQFDQRQQYATFREIVKHVPGADQMHYLVSTAAIGYIRQLDERIPEVVDAFGKPFIPFKNFRFEIIQSHIQDKKQHKVAVYFYSEVITWVDTVDGLLLVVPGDHAAALNNGQEIETDLLAMRPGLSVHTYRQGATTVL